MANQRKTGAKAAKSSPAKPAAAKPAAAKRKPAKRSSVSPELKAAYGDLSRGVKSVEKLVAEVRKGLRAAEKKIEADARKRVNELRKMARAQMRIMQAKRLEAMKTLRALASSAGESWQDIKRSADAILAEARAAAESVVERFRNVGD